MSFERSLFSIYKHSRPSFWDFFSCSMVQFVLYFFNVFTAFFDFIANYFYPDDTIDDKALIPVFKKGLSCGLGFYNLACASVL